LINTALMVILVMGLVGIVFGFILAVANKKFAVEVNPLIHIVEDVLPKGQCGACGYAGCLAYAEAVVIDPAVAPNLCIPGKEPVAKMVAELTNKTAPAVEPRIAHVKCAGTTSKAQKSFNYEGVEDCFAANLIFGGPKGCKYGCLGFGTCVRNCPFDAMTMSSEGLPIIDEEKCTGCGKCESVCPKQVIQIVPIGSKVSVDCNSKDKGAVARKLCSVSCLGCGLCGKNCSYGAIKIENSLAVVDQRICLEKCEGITCISNCPTGAIKPAIIEVFPGEGEQEDNEVASTREVS
jgi:Na+-translocating ferredoxin:NAD+ oxidoreductase subunit B